MELQHFKHLIMDQGKKFVLVKYVDGLRDQGPQLFFDEKSDLTLHVSLLPVIPSIKYTVMEIIPGAEHKPPGFDFAKSTLDQLNSGVIKTELPVIMIPEPMPPVKPTFDDQDLEFAMMDVPGFKLNRTGRFEKIRGTWFFRGWE